MPRTLKLAVIGTAAGALSGALSKARQPSAPWMSLSVALLAADAFVDV